MDLYHAVQTMSHLGAPARWWARQWQWALQNPATQTVPGVKEWSAAFEILEHAVSTHTRPDFDIHSTIVDGKTVGVTEDVVREHAFCDLLHFRKDVDLKQPKVYIVVPLSGHFPTLLRGTVETFLRDHDVYITDWKNARDVPAIFGRFGLDEYMDVIRDHFRHLGRDTHVVAVCQPAVPVLAVVSRLAEDNEDAQPRTMTLMGGPIDTRVNPTAVNDFATSKSMSWFGQRVISRVPFPYMGAMREVYPGFLQLSGFMSMNFERHLQSHKEMYYHLVEGDGESYRKKRSFYKVYMAVMDLAAEFFLETTDYVFKKHLLPRGLFPYRGRPVKPSCITKTAVQVVEGENDDICGVGQTKAALALLTGLQEEMKAYHLQPEVGHYGVFNGKRWNTEIFPVVARFIQAHS